MTVLSAGLATMLGERMRPPRLALTGALPPFDASSAGVGFGRDCQLLATVKRCKKRDAHKKAGGDAGQEGAGKPAQRNLASVRCAPAVRKDRRLVAERPDHFLVGDHSELGAPDLSCRILAGDTLREDVHLSHTGVKSMRGGQVRACTPYNMCIRVPQAPPRDAPIMSLRSVDCEEVRAKMCLRQAVRRRPKVFSEAEKPAFPGFVRKLSFILKLPVDVFDGWGL